jgi:hypothetical protein
MLLEDPSAVSPRRPSEPVHDARGARRRWGVDRSRGESGAPVSGEVRARLCPRRFEPASLSTKGVRRQRDATASGWIEPPEIHARAPREHRAERAQHGVSLAALPPQGRQRVPAHADVREALLDRRREHGVGADLDEEIVAVILR